MSRVFSFTCGVCQGGVLSPTLFAVSVDDLMRKLVESGLGCSVSSVNIGCLFYADDIVLLSVSLCKLQDMLNISSGELSDFDLVQLAKCHVIRIGSKKVKYFLSHKAHRAALISVSLALSQTPAYTARPRIRG